VSVNVNNVSGTRIRNKKFESVSSALYFFQNLGIFSGILLKYRRFFPPLAFSNQNTAPVTYFPQPQSKTESHRLSGHNPSVSRSREIQHALFQQCLQVLHKRNRFICFLVSQFYGELRLFRLTQAECVPMLTVLKGCSSCICVVCIEAQSAVVKPSWQRT
jgi:hypothetical protein